MSIIKTITGLALFIGLSMGAQAQITGKFGTYYDQRELLFESLPTSPNDIIFLGNSITDGGEWCEIFENPNCKNRGISGDIIPGVLNRLETITKGKPAQVFLMIGTNDMNYGTSNDSIALGVRTIVQRIKKESPKTKITVQSILPTNDCYGLFSGHTKRWHDVAVINNMLKTIAIEEGVEYLDLYHPFATEEGKLNPKYSNDGLHLNGEGYALWKENIEKHGVGKHDKVSLPSRRVYEHGRVPVWIHLGLGLNIINSYDLGVSPQKYLGVGGNFKGGAIVEWKRYHVQTDTRILGNLMFNETHTSSSAFGGDIRGEFLYHGLDFGNNRWHLWYGGGFQSYLDFKLRSHLMNASLGYSSFFNLQGICKVQYDFLPIFGGTHRLFSVYAKLSLPMVGWAKRPDFAYIGNATSDPGHFMTLLKYHKTNALAFPGASTDLGFVINLPNSNKIGLSYCWDYLTTRHQGVYRFDHAAHTVNLTFMFNVN